jgi:hypothetical protein
MSRHWLATTATRAAGSSQSALRVMVLLPPVRLLFAFPPARKANGEH